MTLPAPLERALQAMPWLSIDRAPMGERGRYYQQHRAILTRHGLRGPAYFTALAHEIIHAQRGDAPCCSPELEARQEAIVNRDTARLLIDIRDLAEAAAALAGDPHAIADELGVTYEMIALRVKHLHPSERAFLQRRLEHTEETA